VKQKKATQASKEDTLPELYFLLDDCSAGWVGL
jgi:hypothetical protein